MRKHLKGLRVKSQGLSLNPRLSCIAILLLAFCILNYNCYAQSLTSRELIENAKEYDGKIVTYEGELIGEPLKRKEGTWLNLYNQTGGALGVWVPKNIPANILYAGGYKTVGDRLRSIGKFHRACLAHGGDLDIHADKIIQIEPGRARLESIPLYKKNLLAILSGILLCLLPISIILKKTQGAS